MVRKAQTYNPDKPMKSEPKIMVAIRKRPLTKKEVAKNELDIVEIQSEDTLTIKELRQKVDLTKYIEEHVFTFDGVFSENDTNEDLYNRLVQPMVASAFARAKVTCFAYGQTGSGKTFTMMGNVDSGVPGLYLLAANDIFAMLDNHEYNGLVVGISFYEIYCGKAHDLLNGREQCAIRVDAKENVNIVGLTEKIIANTESLMALIHFGLSVRITGTTGMNDDSSRSHAILQITLRSKTNGKLHGKMSFIDLAGSERGADVTDTNKQTRFDGAEINKSLLALKECIRALDMDKKHLPFRGSKLTLVLKDSFIGNCKTLMIGNISPGQVSCEHTLNTLRYADRVKELKKPSGGQGAGPKNSKDELARALMLPRMNQNSHKIEYNNQKTVDDNIVFEAYDVNGGGKGKINMEGLKSQNPLDKMANNSKRISTPVDFNNRGINFQRPNQSYGVMGNPRQQEYSLNDDDVNDNYEDPLEDPDEDSPDHGRSLSPMAKPYPHSLNPSHRGMLQEPLPAKQNFQLNNNFLRTQSPQIQKLKVQNEGLLKNPMNLSGNNSLINARNTMAETNSAQNYPTNLLRPPAPAPIMSGQLAPKANSFLSKDRGPGQKTPGVNFINTSADRDTLSSNLARKTNLGENGKAQSNGMQIEYSDRKNPSRNVAPRNYQEINYQALERISQQQDDLIEEHSNQIDDLVACVKEDMSILQNVKDTRKLISDRHNRLHQENQNVDRSQAQNHPEV